MTTVMYERGESLAQLRRTVVLWAQDRGGADPFDVALIVDELVTNAIVHGGARRVAVHLDTDGAQVEVAVDDPSAAAPTLALGADLAEHGRGLLMIEALSSRPAVLAPGALKSLSGVHLAFTGILSRPRKDAIRAAARAGAIVHSGPSARTSVVVRGRPNPLQAAGRDGGLKLMEIKRLARRATGPRC